MKDEFKREIMKATEMHGHRAWRNDPESCNGDERRLLKRRARRKMKAAARAERRTTA